MVEGVVSSHVLGLGRTKTWGLYYNSDDDALFEIADKDEPALKVPAGRSTVFRRYDPDQPFLMPPSRNDWLPHDHTARLVAEFVDGLLDLSTVYDLYG